MSPKRRRITSPGTSSLAFGVVHFPSRLARALTASLALRAAIALPAWCSSQNPTTAFEQSRSRMMKKSIQCRTTPDKITAASIIQGIGPQKYVRNFRISFVFFSAISLGPYCVSRFCASVWLSPSGEDFSLVCNSDIGSDLRSLLGAGLGSEFFVFAFTVGSACSRCLHPEANGWRAGGTVD